MDPASTGTGAEGMACYLVEPSPPSQLLCVVALDPRKAGKRRRGADGTGNASAPIVRSLEDFEETSVYRPSTHHEAFRPSRSK